MTQARRHDLFAIAILSLLATLLFADVVTGRGDFYFRDIARFFYPNKHVLREIVSGGEFPFWNRHVGSGQPLAANPQHEVFYPLTWLMMLPTLEAGFRIEILAHVYLGLLGMYFLLRSMELLPPSAFFGALAFGFGGVYLSYINLLPILFAAVWIPLICLYARKFLLTSHFRHFAIASFFFGMQCLVGEPTTIMQTGFLLGMYALYRGWSSSRENFSWKHAAQQMLRCVGSIGAIAVTAFAVGAVQMIPALDHVGDSARSRGFDFSLVGAWSFPPAKLIELVYPNFLGYISFDQTMWWYWGRGLYPEAKQPFIFSIYPGLLCTALVAATLFRRRREHRFVLLVAVLSFVAALGSHTPLLRFLYDRGIGTALRYPEKFVLAGSFALIVLAAISLQQMLDGDESIRSRAMHFSLGSAIVAGLMAALAATGFLYPDAFRTVWGLPAGNVANRMAELSRGGWIEAAIRGVALFLLLGSLRRIHHAVWLTLAGLLVFVDLAMVGQRLTPRIDPAFFTEAPPVVSSFPADRSTFRIFHEADWDNGDDATAYHRTGPAVPWLERNGLFPMHPALHGFEMAMERDYDKTALLPTVDFLESAAEVRSSGRPDWYRPLMAMSNAWFRGTYRPYADEARRVGGAMERAAPVQFEEVGRQPRYYFATQMATIRKRSDFAALLSRRGLSDGIAIVGEQSFRPAPGVVRDVRESANRATIEIDATGRAFLVMSVTPHKYWDVRLDGRRVRPILTNIGFQGIEVPAGRHTVQMRYHNPLIGLAGGISSITLLLLAAMAIGFERRHGGRACSLPSADKHGAAQPSSPVTMRPL